MHRHLDEELDKVNGYPRFGWVDIIRFLHTIGRTAGHEFGHLLRLEHVKDGSNLMNPKSEGANFMSNNINVGIMQYDYKRRKSHETLLKITGGKR